MVVVNSGNEIIYDLKLEVTVEKEGIFLRTSVMFKSEELLVKTEKTRTWKSDGIIYITVTSTRTKYEAKIIISRSANKNCTKKEHCHAIDTNRTCLLLTHLYIVYIHTFASSYFPN